MPIRQLILATNENDVLDEFFRTGRYRVRTGAEVEQTSSPSMDISKASNFERFVYDLTGRDPAAVAELWRKVDSEGGFDLSEYADFAERIAAIRLRVRVEPPTRTGSRPFAACISEYGVIIDTHTADGLKVGLEHREAGRSRSCAWRPRCRRSSPRRSGRRSGASPRSRRGFEDLERMPQRVEVMDADVEAVKAFIARHCDA